MPEEGGIQADLLCGGAVWVTRRSHVKTVNSTDGRRLNTEFKRVTYLLHIEETVTSFHASVSLSIRLVGVVCRYGEVEITVSRSAFAASAAYRYRIRHTG